MFTEHASHKPSLQARKDALLRRLQLRAALNHVDVIEDIEKQRLKAMKLSTIVRSARAQFDQALAELGSLMPTRSTKLDGDAHPSPSVTYTFDAAPNLSLVSPFRLQVAVALHEDRSTVDIYARASKGQGGNEVGWTHLGAALESLDGISDLFQEWIFTIIEELASK